MTTTSTESVAPGRMVDLGRYRRAAIRQWPIIVLFAVAGAVGGYLLLPAATYESSAVIQVQQGLRDVTLDPATAGGPNMSTEQQVATSASVIGQALHNAPGGLSVPQFQARASASTPPDSTTMTLSFTADSAKDAQATAQAWADAYLDSRTRDLQTAQNNSEGILTDTINTLTKQQTAAQRAVDNALPDTIQEQRAQTSLNTINNQLRIERAKLSQLNGLVIDAGSIIGAPLVPQHPSGLTAGPAVAIGLFAGALLGLVIALVRERLSNRVRDARDVARATTAPVWATIRRGNEVELQRAYDALAARLLLGARHRGLRSVLVTSTQGSGLLPVVHLAAAIERLGQRAEVTTDVDQLLASTREHALAPERGGGLLIVPAPALLDDPRTAVLASEADTTLLVTEIHYTKVSDIVEAENLVVASGAWFSGVVLVYRGSHTERVPPGWADDIGSTPAEPAAPAADPTDVAAEVDEPAALDPTADADEVDVTDEAVEPDAGDDDPSPVVERAGSSRSNRT